MLNFKKYVLALALVFTASQSAVFADETTMTTEATQDHAVEVAPVTAEEIPVTEATTAE